MLYRRVRGLIVRQALGKYRNVNAFNNIKIKMSENLLKLLKCHTIQTKNFS